MFSFIGNYQTVFQSSVILHFFQHWMNFSCSTSFFFIFSVFWNLAILKGVQWHLIVLSCVCLVTFDMVHLSICLFVLCVTLVEIPVGWFLKSTCSLYHYWVLIDLYILGQQLFIRCDFCKYFFLVCGLSSNFLDIVFHTAQIFNLNEVQLLLSWLMPLTLYLKSHNHIPSHLGFREPVKLST